MGALHRGHGQLIKSVHGFGSLQPAAVLVSVFVNPLQFAPAEDFDSYPRDLEADCELASRSGASALWAPSVDQVFPGGASSHFRIQVPSHLQAHLCGASRPGHFDGVVTVVARLLALVRPEVLVLGEKDWQQLVILRHLVAQLGLPVRVHGVATVRDDDGLACSSRNRYLMTQQRQQALALPQLLARAARESQDGRAVDLAGLRCAWEQLGLEVEYVEKVDAFNLQPLHAGRKLCLLAAAVRCGETRLIDHTFLMSRQPIVAIDGPAGAGKSTVTRAFAERLGLLYLDTGAMYRAVTWLTQQHDVDPHDPVAVKTILENLELELEPSQSGAQTVRINGHDVTEAIRSPEVTSSVSVVAAHGCVRKALTAQQQRMGVRGGLVAEGRDIGTAVFPDAELKVFLTASPAERARRRALDLDNRGLPVPDLAELETQIEERDRMDSTREVAPLRQAEDATELISDGMTIEEVIETLIELFRVQVPEEVWPTAGS
ncbi:Cytidylate kinase [Prochlorococcus marinus str. MIT 1342]|nr:Cytidylate kinase [Prochlorococcus marinus str. MIT 1342]